MNRIKHPLLWIICSVAPFVSCQEHPDTNKNNMTKTTNTNPLLCDPTEGTCEIPPHKESNDHSSLPKSEKPIKIVYFTDPICSSCWGIEPQLRRMKLEYGHAVEVEYHMGGLLPDWSYNSGGISKPSDVAHHWDEVSVYYNMPIDGDVWLEDPLNSSYPPSIAFKAAQIQDESKAIEFLRILREQVFLQKKNITKWEHISDAATKSGLDVTLLKKHYESFAKDLFQSDLQLAQKYGVRGFPTIFIINDKEERETIYGFRPYSVFESAITKVAPSIEKVTYEKGWKQLFDHYPTLTLREFAELSDLSIQESSELLKKLTAEKKLIQFDTKNGSIWRITSLK